MLCIQLNNIFLRFSGNNICDSTLLCERVMFEVFPGTTCGSFHENPQRKENTNDGNNIHLERKMAVELFWKRPDFFLFFCFPGAACKKFSGVFDFYLSQHVAKCFFKTVYANDYSIYSKYIITISYWKQFIFTATDCLQNQNTDCLHVE